MTQISTIKPVDITKPKVKPNFTFDDNAYQSYIQEGFEVPNQGPWQERKGIPLKGRPEAWQDQSPDKDQ